MDVLRARLLEALRTSDRFRRLRLYYPQLPDPSDQCLNIHSKVLIVDDEFLRVGSANLSNRSMGFDTECDLAVEAGGESRIREPIARFRNRLLAEHLGVAPEQVAASLKREGSLAAAVERLCGGERTLKILNYPIPSAIDAWTPDADLIDPDRPLVPDIVPRSIIPREAHVPAGRRITAGVTILLILLVLAAVWHWTPLRQWLDIPTLADNAARFKGNPIAPVLTVGVFLIGGARGSAGYRARRGHDTGLWAGIWIYLCVNRHYLERPDDFRHRLCARLRGRTPVIKPAAAAVQPSSRTKRIVDHRCRAHRAHRAVLYHKHSCRGLSDLFARFCPRNGVGGTAWLACDRDLRQSGEQRNP